MTDDRTYPAYEADERTMLSAWLEWHRATLAWKCDGLDHAQLRERSVPPSSLSLLGLIRHMTEVERSWFRRAIGAEDAPPIYFSDADPDGDFDNIADADVDEAFASWRAECERAREIVAAAPSLEVTGLRRNGDRVTLRWVMTHMVEEYARHNGHADLLRERIDGATGE